MAFRCGPSNENGLVTTATVSAPISCAISAMTGLAPDPVPPPKAAGDKNHVSIFQRFPDFILSFFRARWPISGSIRRQVRASRSSRCGVVRRAILMERLHVSIHGDKLHPANPLFTMRSTAEPPEPPTPTTFYFGKCFNVWFDLRHTIFIEQL